MVVAVKGFAVRDGRVLLIRRADDQMFPGTWEMPGGKVEHGEHLEDALMREFLEEVGLSVKVGRLLYASDFMAPDSRQVVILAYACGDFAGEPRLSFEHVEYRWASEAEARGLLPEGILRDIDRFGAFRALHVSP